mmetsp:Transcript_47441/g.91706  ORF Transcript_47441/g.91706 Transcript_47441/m.91706 type:complete len:278 (-) Transcript_47441:907-1740(-)
MCGDGTPSTMVLTPFINCCLGADTRRARLLSAAAGVRGEAPQPTSRSRACVGGVQVPLLAGASSNNARPAELAELPTEPATTCCALVRTGDSDGDRPATETTCWRIGCGVRAGPGLRPWLADGLCEASAGANTMRDSPWLCLAGFTGWRSSRDCKSSISRRCLSSSSRSWSLSTWSCAKDITLLPASVTWPCLAILRASKASMASLRSRRASLVSSSFNCNSLRTVEDSCSASLDLASAAEARASAALSRCCNACSSVLDRRLSRGSFSELLAASIS